MKRQLFHLWNKAMTMTADLKTVERSHIVSTRRLFTFGDLGTFPDPSWLIPGEIPERGLTMLYGASGSGKSFAALDYALRVAVTGRQVVYIAAEGVGGYYGRATAWVNHHNYSGDGLLFDLEPLRLSDNHEVGGFIDGIVPHQPALVIIDTLARCMIGLDENSSRDMGIAVEACGAIIRRTGAAVMVVHHTGKSGASERGSSALFGACDSVISLSNEDGIIALACAKSKDSKPFDTRFLRMIEVEVTQERTSCVLVPADRVNMKGAPLSPTQKKILETLALETFVDVGARAAVLQRATGIADTSLYRALGALMRSGYVRQAEKGDPYYIEARGHEAIAPKNEVLPPFPNDPQESHGSTTLSLPPHPPPFRVGVGGSSGGSPNGGKRP